MLRPGEIYLADTESGQRPAVIVSREESNRGNWVVAVLITSTQFAVRFMKDSVSRETLMKLVTRDGGEVIGSDEY